jgi:DNA-binding transcriptional LysR family regulator
MKLHSLRLFQAVCQYQGVTKAVQALNISQPAFAYAIKELEAEFGVTLMMKKGRGAVLTEEGKKFYQLVGDLLAHADATERALREVAERNPKIHIGITPLLNVTLFPQIKTALRKAFPEIALQRYELSSASIKERLLNGELDCAICSDAFADDEWFQSLPIATTEYVCCVGREHPLADQLSISLPQLKDELIVVFDRTFDDYHYLHDAFERYEIKPQILMETNQIETIRNTVAAGNAISFLYKGFAELYPKQLVSIPLEDEVKTQTICLLWPRNRDVTSNLANIVTYMSKNHSTFPT